MDEEEKTEEIEEKKEQKERKGVFMGLTLMQLFLFLLVFALFIGAAFATSHFKRLSRDLEYSIRQNTTGAIDEGVTQEVPVPGEEGEDVDETTVNEEEVMEEEEEPTPTPEAEVNVELNL